MLPDDAEQFLERPRADDVFWREGLVAVPVAERPLADCRVVSRRLVVASAPEHPTVEHVEECLEQENGGGSSGNNCEREEHDVRSRRECQPDEGDR